MDKFAFPVNADSTLKSTIALFSLLSDQKKSIERILEKKNPSYSCTREVSYICGTFVFMEDTAFSLVQWQKARRVVI